MDRTINEPIFAVSYREGRWSVLAACVRELSGRVGVRRVQVIDEPRNGELKVHRSDCSTPEISGRLDLEPGCGG
jgi:hypothetical protein